MISWSFFKSTFAKLNQDYYKVLIGSLILSVSLYFVPQLYGDGYALTGNASEFLDPVFSSGMAFATESGMMAAKLAKKQLDGENVDWEKDYSDYILSGVKVFTTYVQEWYTGNLQTLFFHQPENPEVKEKICAVLAGYVWNEENSFVKKHDHVIANMAYLLNMQKEQSSE